MVTRPNRASNGAGEEERRTDLARELGVEIRLGDAARIDAHLVRTSPLDVGPEIGEKLDHRLHVPDARDIGEAHLVRGEHTCGEDRKRAVLVPQARTVPERVAALDDEGLHRAGNGTGGLHPVTARSRASG